MSAWRVVERADRDRLGEGLWWSARDDALWWCDILGQRLHRLTLADGAVRSWNMPEPIGWVIERDGAPGFVAGFRSGVVGLTLDPLNITPLIDPEPDRPGNRLNDAKADRFGRVWFGTMKMTPDEPVGSLYRLDPDGAVGRHDRGYGVCNGPAFSPTGYVMYHTDSVAGRVYRFDLHNDGTLGARALFIQFEEGWGSPDGMTCDADGGLWIAHWEGARVSRFHPDGRLDRSIALPTARITNVVFAGADLNRMFVTSAMGDPDDPHAGALFELDSGAVGILPWRFAG